MVVVDGIDGRGIDAIALLNLFLTPSLKELAPSLTLSTYAIMMIPIASFKPGPAAFGYSSSFFVAF